MVSGICKIKSITPKSVLGKFLNKSEISTEKKNEQKTAIFPFGCNYSQIKAVENAINNQISVIEGPPGTGKTQTILNIIANIILLDKNVAVVSNNNSATDNVFEKLDRYGFDYIAAQLGSSKNKELFINGKQSEYPDFTNDVLDADSMSELKNEIYSLKTELSEMLEAQNKIAELKNKLAEINTEKVYYDDYYLTRYSNDNFFVRGRKIKSKKLLSLIVELDLLAEKNKSASFWLRAKSYVFNGVRFGTYRKSMVEIISAFKKSYYDIVIAEMNKDIETLQNKLINYDFNNKMEELKDKSHKLLKAKLAHRFAAENGRTKFTADTFWKTPKAFLDEYPVILSTTYSVLSSMKDIVYDYVIVDESSQVDLVTGVLAMSGAKNLIVVGDLKQLPNVVTDKDKKRIKPLSDSADIADEYRYENNSLLSAVCRVFPNVPRVLLREHYRCHPKIINFCNKKFYNNELIIMTEDKGEKDVLKAYITSKGNHARGMYNQRQIDEIKQTIIPELSQNKAHTDIGIIAPYNAQVSHISEDLKDEIDISTVHKFQGREKEDIIISTVDNEITEFTDNPNMLNVAVSRAKNRLRIIVSDNERNENTNIGDLIRYINYNNFEVKKSDICSVFDMLYSNMQAEREAYLSKHKKISEFDSENLMNALMIEILSEETFTGLDFVVHQPLYTLIKDFSALNDEEKSYVQNPGTHIDFLIYNKMDKSPVLAVEVDGYAFHKAGTAQHERDKLKNSVLDKYNIPLLRLSTVGSGERKRIVDELNKLTS